MPQFTLDRYDVLLDAGQGTEAHQVTIYASDELKAEKEGAKYGLGIKIGEDGQPSGPILGQHLRAAHVWAALTRTGAYDKPLPVFLGQVQLIADREPLRLDPTGAPIDAPSSSATTSPLSPSGSTPTAPAATTT
jgi:hypothetical protein